MQEINEERSNGAFDHIDDGRTCAPALLSGMSQADHTGIDAVQQGNVGANDLLQLIAGWGNCDGVSPRIESAVLPTTR
jgi:hypothetical protein